VFWSYRRPCRAVHGLRRLKVHVEMRHRVAGGRV